LVAVIGRVRQDAEHHTADLDERPLLADCRYQSTAGLEQLSPSGVGLRLITPSQ